MNWDAIGAVGEIVGAVAVVATLFFLATQIRASNALAAAESRDRSFEQMSRLRHLIASDPDVARIWRLGCLGESLSDDESLRFTQIAHDHFLIWRSSYQRAELARRKTIWVPVSALLRILRDPAHPALESVWQDFVQSAELHNDTFVKQVQQSLSEGGT
jgi:hypothetical protein